MPASKPPASSTSTPPPAHAAPTTTSGSPAHPHDDHLPCCLPPGPRLTGLPLPALDDDDGVAVPDDLPPVIDSHVHAFPPALMAAIWRWFDHHGWPIRDKLHAEPLLETLRRRGLRGCVLLHYAHKPGIARGMNAFVAQLVDDAEGFAVGTGTVCPGEPNSVDIVDEAFSLGLQGIKLHCHVQGMPIDDERLFPVYELCQARGKPAVVHAGREPWSDALPVDPYEVCAVDRTERVLTQFPHLTLVVPHLGADEFDAYRRLLHRYDHLYLDTTMMAADYFDVFDGVEGSGTSSTSKLSTPPWLPFVCARPDRMLYGSDAPNLPYAWDRELRALAQHLPDTHLEAILGGNAQQLWGPWPSERTLPS